MTYEIEKDVPMPNTRNRTKYPWAEMEVGDSILCETVNARLSAYHYGHRYGLKFSARIAGVGVRIWRVE